MPTYSEKYPDKYNEYKQRLAIRYKNDEEFRMKRIEYAQAYEIKRKLERHQQKLLAQAQKETKDPFQIIEKRTVIIFK